MYSFFSATTPTTPESPPAPASPAPALAPVAPAMAVLGSPAPLGALGRGAEPACTRPGSACGPCRNHGPRLSEIKMRCC